MGYRVWPPGEAGGHMSGSWRRGRERKQPHSRRPGRGPASCRVISRGMKHAGWIGLLLGLVMWAAAPARADSRRVWVKQIESSTAWAHYSKRVSSDELGKFIIDVRTN